MSKDRIFNYEPHDLWDDEWVLPYESMWSIRQKFKYMNGYTKEIMKEDDSDAYPKNLYSTYSNTLCNDRRYSQNIAFWKKNNMYSEHLRICPQCLKNGYHSDLHQLSFFDNCFLHEDIRLQNINNVLVFSNKSSYVSVYDDDLSTYGRYAYESKSGPLIDEKIIAQNKLISSLPKWRKVLKNAVEQTMNIGTPQYCELIPICVGSSQKEPRLRQENVTEQMKQDFSKIFQGKVPIHCYPLCYLCNKADVLYKKIYYTYYSYYHDYAREHSNLPLSEVYKIRGIPDYIDKKYDVSNYPQYWIQQQKESWQIYLAVMHHMGEFSYDETIHAINVLSSSERYDEIEIHSKHELKLYLSLELLQSIYGYEEIDKLILNYPYQRNLSKKQQTPYKITTTIHKVFNPVLLALVRIMEDFRFDIDAQDVYLTCDATQWFVVKQIVDVIFQRTMDIHADDGLCRLPDLIHNPDFSYKDITVIIAFSFDKEAEKGKKLNIGIKTYFKNDSIECKI